MCLVISSHNSKKVNMSNLGPYQDFTTKAARSGGIANLIKEIEAGAVANAAPGLIGKGAGIGAAITFGAVLAIAAGKHLWDTKKNRECAAIKAKEHLKLATEAQTASESLVDDNGQRSIDPDENQ